MNQKVLCRIVWTRFGLERFQREVNASLKEGWVVRELAITPRLFRLVCVALLEDPDGVITDE